MALLSRGALTKKGKDLIAKSETRNVGIEITKAISGSGIHENSSSETLEEMTELLHPIQEFPISGLEMIDGNSGVAVITVTLHNRGLKELYYLNELGIYANDPDEGEVLYCILVSENNMTYMPPDNESGGISTITERIYIEVANAEKTTIEMNGALVSAKEFQALKEIVDIVTKNIMGGNAGQMLVKTGNENYEYEWQDINTITKPYKDFPETGRENAIYIDSDTANIYIWKILSNGKKGYFKLPLGAEASETLQKQISENAKNILKLQDGLMTLERQFSEIELIVPENGWREEADGEIIVYKQELSVTGITEKTPGTIYPRIRSTNTKDIINEMEAAATFFGRGISDSRENAILLRCFKKKPKVDFGIIFQGPITEVSP